MFRRALFVLAVIGLLGVAAAIAVWLGWHSDAELARWSSIAGIISAGLSVLAVVLALAPILDRKNGKGEADRPRVSVTQNIKHNRGPIQGEGVQVNSFKGPKR